MLTAMLNTSEEVLCTSEELFSIYFFKKYRHKTTWTDSQIKDFTKELFLMMENSPEIYFGEFNTLYENLLNHKESLNYELLIRIVYLHFIDIKDKSKIKVIVDKQIKFLFHLAEMKKIFPDSKIILLTRDIRDNVLSKSNRNINGTKDIFFHAGTWNATYKNIDKLYQLFPNQIMIVHYENLASQPKETLIKICEHLSINFSEKMLEFHIYFKNFLDIKNNNRTEKKLIQIKDFHESMFSEINNKKIGIWSNNMDKITSQKISAIGYETGLKLGYDFSKPNGLSQIKNTELKSLSKSVRMTVRLFNFYLKIPLTLKLLIKRFRNKLSIEI